MQPSTVSQEPTNSLGVVSQLGSFLFNYYRRNCDGHSTFLSNRLYFDLNEKPKVVASLSLSTKGAAFGVWRVVNEFNRAIRLDCERISLGFASVGIGSEENSGFGDDKNGVVEESEGDTVNRVPSKTPKKVLILMSDTGGGHRASAEAIKAAFNEEFGDDYQVCVRWDWTFILP